MNRLFEPVAFANKPIIWNYSSLSDKQFQGYYHWHQCCEMLIVHQGSGIVAVNSQTYEIRRGMLFFFQPFELHKVFAQITQDEPYIRTIIHIDPVMMEGCLQPFTRRGSLFAHLWKGRSATRAYDFADGMNRIDDALQQYEQACLSGYADHKEEITLLMLQLLTAIGEAGQNEGSREKASRRQERYSEKIMSWLESNHSDEFILDRLASELHLSKFYVSRLFREETGSSITEYLTASRIMHACHLLETSAWTVERIGAEVGLPNTSHFIHTFKRVIGLTPFKYRRLKREV